MKEIGLYVHIPFCKQKCMYCDFPSYAGKEKYMDKYIEALSKEIEEKGKQYIIKSIFIGGGTPSYLDEKNLDNLLNSICKLKIKDDAEFTVECNPGTLNEKKLKIMKANKVNRLSMGLQSTDNNLLKIIGRIHTYELFEANFSLARRIGFNNINIDIMFGLPNQNVEIYEETLKKIVMLNPEHISAYSLIVEEGTRFHELYQNGTLNLPNEDDEREMYYITKKILERHNYKQYEISNFSKNSKECSHNKIYWECKEYLGVGASASSYINKKRMKNLDNIKKYIQDIESGKSVCIDVHENTMRDEIEEYIFMGLRMIRGIDLEEFRDKFNKDIYTIYPNEIKKHIENKLLVIEDGRMKLSRQGIEYSNYVMSDFILT